MSVSHTVHRPPAQSTSALEFHNIFVTLSGDVTPFCNHTNPLYSWGQPTKPSAFWHLQSLSNWSGRPASTDLIIKMARERMYLMNSPDEPLMQFYTAIIESVLRASVTVWFELATKQDEDSLQPTEKITGADLPTIQDLYTCRVRENHCITIWIYTVQFLPTVHVRTARREQWHHIVSENNPCAITFTVLTV